MEVPFSLHNLLFLFRLPKISLILSFTSWVRWKEICPRDGTVALVAFASGLPLSLSCLQNPVPALVAPKGPVKLPSPC